MNELQLSAIEIERIRENDTVFLALTRPPMVWGVPLGTFTFMPAITFICIIVGNNPFIWGPIAFFGQLGLARVLTAWDAHFVRRIKLGLVTWGGKSPSPLPTSRPTTPDQLFIQYEAG